MYERYVYLTIGIVALIVVGIIAWTPLRKGAVMLVRILFVDVQLGVKKLRMRNMVFRARFFSRLSEWCCHKAEAALKDGEKLGKQTQKWLDEELSWFDTYPD